MICPESCSAVSWRWRPLTWVTVAESEMNTSMSTLAFCESTVDCTYRNDGMNAPRMKTAISTVTVAATDTAALARTERSASAMKNRTLMQSARA